MRLAVNAWFWDRPTTGSGQYTRRLVEGIAALAPEVEVHLIAPGPRWFRTTRFEFQSSGPFQLGAEFSRPNADRLNKVWFEQVAFPRACAHLDADVAHVPYWAPPLRPGVPAVITIHDLIPLLLPEYRGGLMHRLYTSLASAAARNAAMVLTDSEASRRDIVAHLGLPAERVRAIPLAAGERFRPDSAADDVAIRERYGLPKRYLLYLGGFDRRKNVVTALRACRRVRSSIGSGCPLVIAGRLPEQDSGFAPDPRRLAREEGLDERFVRFIGFVDEAHKPAVYRGAVAFIFPSRYEGFGLPPLEAMACGIPVVGSEAASLPEVIGNGGLLLPPDDAAGMADALIRLVLDDDFRARMSQQALAQASGFSWKRTARQTLVTYKMLMDVGG